MSLSGQLREAVLSEWKKTAQGYEMETSKGKAKLYRKGTKEWFVSVAGKERSIGRKASFGHAEGYLKQMGAKPQ